MARRDWGQCCKPVTHIVRHPYWQGDAYHVCTKHIEWAKLRVGEPVVVKSVAPRDITSGCVYWDATQHPTPRNRVPLPKEIQ